MQVVRKIYQVKARGQLLVSVPKNVGLKAGDLVELVKVKIVREK